MQIELYDCVTVRDNVLVIGDKGSGKTTLVKNVLKNELGVDNRLRPDVLVMTNRAGEYEEVPHVTVVRNAVEISRAIDGMVRPRLERPSSPLIIVIDPLYWEEMEMRGEGWYGPFMKRLYSDGHKYGITIFTVASDSFRIHRSIVDGSTLRIYCRATTDGHYSAREMGHAEALKAFKH